MISKNVLPAPFAHQLRTARELAEDLRRAPDERQLATASPTLDRLLAGGLRRGAMVELVGRRSSGRFSLVLAALAAATASGEAAALVDLGDGFDPQAAAAAGVELERLLWVRPRRLKEVLASTEAILRSGMPLVVIDLGMPPIPGGRGAEASWLRLARSAQAHRAALLISSPYRVSGTAAQAVLEARRPRARWGGRGSSPWLLRGVSARLELVKSRGFRNAGPRNAGPRNAGPRGIGPREGDAEPLSLRVAADLGGGPPPAAAAERGEVVEWRRRAIA